MHGYMHLTCISENKCSGQILIFIKIATHAHLIRILLCETASPIEYLPETALVRTEENTRVPPLDHFSPSHSSRLRPLAKGLCGSESQSPQRWPTTKSSISTTGYNTAAGFCDMWRHSHCQITLTF